MKQIQSSKQIKQAFLAAFPHTVPILTGFLFLGIAYGISMNAAGFSPIYPIMMSLTIYAGSMEFVTANLLTGQFDPFGAFLLTLMVNARHLFYGISMLEKYHHAGRKKWYLIFGMCDESFSVNFTADPPEGIDRGWFYTFVTLLNQCYWVLGAALGGIFGSLISFHLKGLDFVMTALFLVLFLEQWLKEQRHLPTLVGLASSCLCLLLFGSENFMIPAMLVILAALTFLHHPISGGKTI